MSAADSELRVATPQEGRELFDRQARHLLGVSGDEFVRRYNAGEYRGDEENPAIERLTLMLPFIGVNGRK